MIAALILAAGKGQRFGNDQLPKQFTPLAGKPLFVHSVATYVSLQRVDRVVVTCHPDFAERMRHDLERHALLDAVDLVIGGATRQASVSRAAAAVGDINALGHNDLLILHNAASPNTSAQFLNECIDAIEGYEVVQACLPDTRTVFEKDGELVGRVLPRASLVYNCDPSIYRADALARVLQAQSERGATGETTIDTALEFGYRVRLVNSTYDNIKVTTPYDIAAIRSALGDA